MVIQKLYRLFGIPPKGRMSRAAARKHRAPMNVPALASAASANCPVEGRTNAPTAETPNAMEPTMFNHVLRQSRACGSHSLSVSVVATTASALATRNASEPTCPPP